MVNIESVDLPKAYRLLNHGPTVLITTMHGVRKDVMAAAWAMAVDFDPAKLVVVVDSQTLTRELMMAEGFFGITIPSAAQIDLVNAVGNISGRDVDKFAAFRIETFPGDRIAAPHVAGGLAWLECKIIPEPGIEKRHDMIVAHVISAKADCRAFSNGRWTGADYPLKTIHHVAAGNFFLAGEMREARPLDAILAASGAIDAKN